MKRTAILALAVAWAGAAAFGCAQKETSTAEAPAAKATASTETTAAAAAPETTAAPAASSFTGAVTETMDAGGYTYVQVDTGSEKVWGAAPKFTVAVGDRVTVPATMPMKQYESKTLNRTFDVVYFAGAILPEGATPAPAAPAAAPSGHPGGPIAAAQAAASMDFTGIPKADGGKTVGELLGAASEYAGKEIVVRGKVVKVNNGIMGKNWLHVQDGTGEAGKNDLTVTTDATAKVGDLVLVRGTAAADKDFGAGYKYAFIVEDAKVAVE